MKRFCALFLGVLVTANMANAAQEPAANITPLEILRITPEGENAASHAQIVIEFNRPVVALGAMERKASEIPVEITPPINCQWRWLNSTALSCNLDDADRLKRATEYKITVKPGIKAQDGQTIKQNYQHSFSTERPSIYYANFQVWEDLGVPVIRVNFNQAVTKSSVEKALTLGDDQKIKAYAFWPENNKTKVTYEESNGKKGLREWVIKPTKALPVNITANLNIGEGLEGIEGNLAGISSAEPALSIPTHKDFAFLGIKCATNSEGQITIYPGQKAAQKCNPQSGISLSFSAPVTNKAVAESVKLLDERGNNILANQKAWAEYYSDGQEYKFYTVYREGVTDDIWLPELRATSKYKLVIAQPDHNFFQKIWHLIKSIFAAQPKTGLEDMFGRPLMEVAQVEFETDNRLPNYVIANDPAVLESGIDSEVPLYVQNLDSANFAYNSITAAGSAKNKKHVYSIPNVRNMQFAIPFDVRKMLGGKSGAVSGELHTFPSVRGQGRLFATVTPYHIHAKIGHYNSFVWVTELATGKLVEGAKVTIYKDKISQLNGGARIASAVTGADGTASFAGIEELDPKHETINNWERSKDNFFIKVEKAGEIALMPLSGDFESYSYGADYDYSAYPVSQQKYGHIKSWGTTAQGIYHAGDKIEYKIYVRDQNVKTLVQAPKGRYKLEILDPTDNVVNTVEDIELNEFGALSGDFTTSANAKVGWYTFKLSSNFTETQWWPLRVLVSDFTPAPFKVTNQIDGSVLKPGANIKVSSSARLHSGGPYTDANIRVSAILSQKAFLPKEPALKGYYFNSYIEGQEEKQVFEKQAKLDGKGDLETNFKLEDQKIYFGNLMVESAVQDDRGKYYAATSSASFAGVDRFIGIKTDGWVFDKNKEARINYVVVDENGKPAKNSSALITIEREHVTASKVKSAGNSYVPEYNTTWKYAGGCRVKTLAVPMVCRVTPPEAGYYRIKATVKDTKGAEHITEQNFYVSGSDYVLWNDSSESALRIIPEKESYKVGDVAKFMVRNPYPGATALVAVERYGVIDHFVQKLTGSASVIEVPVKPDYLPGFYMSVTIFSPRVDKPVKDQVDLGKPAFRSGYVQVPVNDEYKKLAVNVTTNKQEYRPRELVNVNLAANKGTKNEPVEFAVVVLDEAVLDLVAGGKNYYDPYKGFYNLDNLDMRNYSLLMRLVGRQNFEKKGANPGGDGGAALAMRDLFKYVAYWNPSIKADANGKANFEFELPDNLTGWRVLAIAVTPSDRIGLGDANFRSNKKTELRPAMPNQLTEGDSFEAAFTVMNRTDKAREVDVRIEAGKVLLNKKVKLEPYKRELLKAKIDAVKAGELTINAFASDSIDKDSVVHKLQVNKRRTLETAAIYGTLEKESHDEITQVPANIYTDSSSISIILSPSVIGNIDGAFEYMRDYQYTCWEQKLSRAVMASNYNRLQPYLGVVWNNTAQMPQQMLDIAGQFQAPNGGMAYYIAEDSRVDPYLTAYTALAFNWLEKSGYKTPQNVEQKLHAYLHNFLRYDSAPDYYDQSMLATTRAIALQALAEKGVLAADDIKRYRTQFEKMSLFGKTAYASAAMSVPETANIAAESFTNILTYSNQSGGKFSFDEKVDSAYTRILSSPTRENCAVLSALVKYANLGGQDKVADIPAKLVRTITQARGKRTYWQNTQENTFCMNALADYAGNYEKTTPDMDVAVKVKNAEAGKTRFESFTDAPVTLSKPIQEADAGQKIPVNITRDGDGKLYYSIRMSYASKALADKHTNAGIEVRREYSLNKKGKFELLDLPSEIKQGDLVKVDIYVTIPSPREFVVVDDPVPGGLEPVNKDLANTSLVDAAAAAKNDAEWLPYGMGFYHQELRHDRAVFYSEYLPAGKYKLSYTAQAIASGKFSIMPVKAEEMYDPDVYGKGISETISISQ